MKSWRSYLLVSVLTASIFSSVQDQSVKDGKNTSQNATSCDIQALEEKILQILLEILVSTAIFLLSQKWVSYNYWEHLNTPSNTSTLGFFQVMRNFNGEQDNKIKPFYCFMSLIRLTIYITFVPKDCCLTSMECCNVQLPLKTKYTYLRSTVSMALYPADRHWKGYTNAPARENTWEQRQATFFTFQLSLLIFICNNLHTAFLLLNTNHSWALTPWLWQHLLPHLTHTEEFVSTANINSLYSVADKWVVKNVQLAVICQRSTQSGRDFPFY